MRKCEEEMYTKVWADPRGCVTVEKLTINLKLWKWKLEKGFFSLHYDGLISLSFMTDMRVSLYSMNVVPIIIVLPLILSSTWDILMKWSVFDYNVMLKIGEIGPYLN